MNPSWPSMLMSSTLARDSSSVLRSRPIGLPRYQVNEKCGPRMPPPTSHWQPTELRRGVHQAGDPGQLDDRLVADAAALREERSVRGVLRCGAVVCGTSGEAGSESEQAANTGIMAAATTASAFACGAV